MANPDGSEPQAGAMVGAIAKNKCTGEQGLIGLGTVSDTLHTAQVETVGSLPFRTWQFDAPPLTSHQAGCFAVSPWGCEDKDLFSHAKNIEAEVLWASGNATNHLATFTQEEVDQITQEVQNGSNLVSSLWNHATDGGQTQPETDLTLPVTGMGPPTNTWSFYPFNLKIVEATEKGDEPRLVVIPFRIRGKFEGGSATAISASVGWNGVLEDLADSIKSGDILVPDRIGRVHFTSTLPVRTAEEVLGGKPFDVLGLTVTAIEHDTSRNSLIRDSIRDNMPSEQDLMDTFSDALGSMANGQGVDCDVDISFDVLAGLKAIVGANDEILGSHTFLWSGSEPLPLFPEESTQTCSNPDGFQHVQYLKDRSFTTEDPILFQAEGGTWEFHARLHNWTEMNLVLQDYPNSGTPCGENPYDIFGDDKPQVLGPTEFNPSTKVPGSSATGFVP